MSYICFENISKSYEDNEVLKNINLQIEKGKLVTLLGPSGCGKSTLLRCLAGLEQVTEGRVLLDGDDITNVNPKDRGIGMVFQQYSLFPNMTIEQNVAFGLKMKHVDKKSYKGKIDEMLEIVGLSKKKKNYPSQLSGGQQQRAALARALVTEPKVLLLDEPLSAIDALLRRSLQMEIRRIQQELDITAIFVTHDQDEAMTISDEIHLMNEGRIEQSASPIDIYTKPSTRFAASFIGHYNILSADEMNLAFGKKLECECVAFRPEAVKLGVTSENEDGLVSKGRVISCVSHGNILRYGVACNDIKINVDVLFDDSELRNVGDEICLSISKNNLIIL